MPSKLDGVAINNELLDRRVKLLKSDKEEIITIRQKEQISYSKLAKMYGVSKRTVYFICNPDKQEENKKCRQERGGWKQYYNKTENTKTKQEHRAYKRELLKNKMIQI